MNPRPEDMDGGAQSDLSPYRVLGALLIAELSAPPPRFSRRRKKLRAAMRARLTEAFLAERERLRGDDGPGPSSASE